MNRELKFRAFNTNTKEIVSWEEMGDDHWDLWNEFKNCKTIMQFTGLLDKNSKEIYEGDLLQDGITVIWREDLASFALRKDGWMYDHYFGEAVDPGHCEVIGNIYENHIINS